MEALNPTIVPQTPVHPLKRIVLLCAGVVLSALGIIGIFLPILPTTCFLLLAATCFARSSDRFYHWLMYNRFFGDYLRNYRAGLGVPRRLKWVSLASLWGTLLLSACFVYSMPWLLVLLAAVGAGVTLHLRAIPTL